MLSIYARIGNMSRSTSTENNPANSFAETVKQIIQLKETEKFTEAIALSTDLYRQAIEAKDYYFAVQALHHQGTAWKILARQTKEPSYARLSWLFFKEAEKLADEGNLPIEEKAVAKFLLGQSEILLENYQSAVEMFEDALTVLQKSDRSQSQKGDFKKHLGEALCLAGKTEEGLNLIKEALHEIRTFDGPDNFTNHVWETGALLALAKFTKDLDLSQAQKYANEALQIAEKENLPIRRKEAETIINDLSVA